MANWHKISLFFVLISFNAIKVFNVYRFILNYITSINAIELQMIVTSGSLSEISFSVSL